MARNRRRSVIVSSRYNIPDYVTGMQKERRSHATRVVHNLLVVVETITVVAIIIIKRQLNTGKSETE